MPRTGARPERTSQTQRIAKALHDPRLGFTVPLTPLAPREQLEYALAAERLGYGSGWMAEAVNADSFSLAGAIGARTELSIGTAIVPIYNRTPMVLAMSAASMSHLTGGRFVLGLGVSTSTIISDWNGVAFDRPLQRMRETVTVVRRLLAGEKVTFAGETVRIAGARLEAPPREPPPVYMAALNPRMLRLAGELADGVIINLLGPEHLQQLLSDVARGAESVGRDPAEVTVVVRLQVAVDADAEAARARGRAGLAPYLASSGYERFFRAIGFESEVEAVTAAIGARDRAAAEAAMTDRLVEALLVHGSRDECLRRFEQYRAAGAHVIVIMPLATSGDDCWHTLNAFAADAFGA
jgi:probable F420-dependent oxidoreductase